MLALLCDGGCMMSAALTLGGLQRVIMALQLIVVGGQRHVIRPVYVPVAFRHLGARLVQIGPFAGSGRGGDFGHLDVWDAVLRQGQLRVGQLQLLHVVDGDSSIKGLLWTDSKLKKSRTSCLRVILSCWTISRTLFCLTAKALHQPSVALITEQYLIKLSSIRKDLGGLSTNRLETTAP